MKALQSLGKALTVYQCIRRDVTEGCTLLRRCSENLKSRSVQWLTLYGLSSNDRIINEYFIQMGASGGAVSWDAELQAERPRVRLPKASLETFRPHFGPWIDSASNRNEYPEYFLGGKGGRCLGLTTLPSSCAGCLESWEPQPPGTLSACPGL
jgi:hypothetical protein